MSNKLPSAKPVSLVPELPFQRIMADAMTAMIKDILTRIRDAQVPGHVPTPEECLEIKTKDLTVNLRFRTDREDVKLPLYLRKLVNEKKSKYFDINLDCYFKNLEVRDDSFSVCLLFTQTWMTLDIPYSALKHISVGSNKLDLVPYFPDEAAPDQTSKAETEAPVDEGKAQK